MKEKEAKAEIIGSRRAGTPVRFKLEEKEIKHIRRCLRYRLFNRPEYESTLTQDLIKKFEKFGRISNRNSTQRNRAERLLRPKECSECKITKNLTIDHMVALCAGGLDRLENMQWLCAYHHTLKNYDWLLGSKEKEIKKIKELVQTFKRRRTPENVKYLSNTKYIT